MSEVISVENYAKRYVPFGAWVVVQKVKAPDKVGNIIMTDRQVVHDTKLSMIGKVIAKSPFKQTDNEYDRYILNHLELGDLVGFSSTVPVYSPAPPGATFEGGLNKDGLDISTLHVGDILGILGKDEVEAATIRGRF